MNMPVNSFMVQLPKAKSKMFDQNVDLLSLKKDAPMKAITGNGKTSAKIRIASWNVNGIRSIINRNFLNGFIHKHNPDIICINQTKIDRQLYAKSPIHLHGFNDYWSFCKVSAGYSGVAIFTKFLPISVFENLEEPEYSQEGRVLTLQFEHFYLIAVYVPSAGKDLERLYYKVSKFQVAFHKHCENIRKRGKAVIIGGDLNVACDHLDTHLTKWSHKTPSFTDLERRSFKNFLALGWIDTYRKLNPTKSQYTWWKIRHKGRQNNVGKRLDYLLVTEEFEKAVISSIVMNDIMGSDHSPIEMDIDLQRVGFYLTKSGDMLKSFPNKQQENKSHQSEKKHQEGGQQNGEKRNQSDTYKQQSQQKPSQQSTLQKQHSQLNKQIKIIIKK